MKLASIGTRIPVAIVILLLTVGTAFAAAPTLTHSQPRGGTDATETEGDGPDEVEPTEAPENEAPEAEAPETEAPDVEAPEAPAAPETPDSATGVSAKNLDRIVGLLADAGITTSASELQTLADQVGVGGAVRVLEFAKDSGKTSAEILAMFQAGEGWGKIRKDLTLTGSSGIGRIMGHGKGHSKHH